MRSPRLSTVGAVCAIFTVACFVVAAISMGSSGVQLLIPETGQPGREWIEDVDAANGLFFVGAWLIILMGFLGIAAFVGFYGVLRDAGEVFALAPVLGTVGLTLVTVSHLVPIAMAYELAIEGISSIGFFVFMLSMGVAILRRPDTVEARAATAGS